MAKQSTSRSDNRPTTLDHLSKKQPMERVVEVVLDNEAMEAVAAAQVRCDQAQREYDSWLADARNRQLRAVATLPVEARERFVLELPDPAGASDRRKPLEAAEEALSAAKEALREQTVRIRFRALGRKAYEKLIAEHPATPEQIREYEEDPNTEGAAPPYNPDTFPPALVAASAVDPVMPLDYVNDIWEEWNGTEITELFTAALIVNTWRRQGLGNG